MADPPRYKRPPIIEAVFACNFVEPTNDRDLERLRDRFKRRYPSIEQQQEIRVELQAGKATTTMTALGYKMTAENAVDVLMLQKNFLGTVRLAPYENWEALIAVAKENHDSFTKVVGRRKISRIGTRYINRIDLPDEAVLGRELTELLPLGIALPETISNVIGPYSLSLQCRESSTGSRVRISSGIVPPALLGHVSILLDIDAYLDADIPGRMEEVWDSAEVLRKAKNQVFENSITDGLRAYFR